MLRLFKWLLLGLLVFLALIVSFQNLTRIKLDFLFWTVEATQAAALAVALASGFSMGLLTSALWRVRAWRSKTARDKLNSSAEVSN